MKGLKDLLYNHCENQINLKLKNYLSIDNELVESLKKETKNSSGDKHETTRAMIQIEREKNGKRIKEIEILKKQLLSIKLIKNNKKKISLGSLVKTNNYNYFIAVSVDKFNFKGNDIYCISQNTPVGKALIGKKVNETFSFNNTKNIINEIIMT